MDGISDLGCSLVQANASLFPNAGIVIVDPSYREYEVRSSTPQPFISLSDVPACQVSFLTSSFMMTSKFSEEI